MDPGESDVTGKERDITFLPLMDDKGYDFIDTFEQRKNIDRLLKRVKQLVKEKEKTKKTEKPAPGPFERLKSRLFLS